MPTQEQSHPHHRFGRSSIGLMHAVLLVLWCALPVQGANDLLRMPAEPSARAPLSILMDVANANGRLVAVGERGHIIYSDDGCSGWTQAEVPVSVTLTAVHFPSARKGWAVGHDGVVLHSDDGGQTWALQLDGIKINTLMLAQVKQLIQSKTRLLEDEANPLDETQIEDLAGEIENLEFFFSDLEAARKEGPIWPLMDVWFKDDREGFIVGAYGMILKTVDGGENWMPLIDRIDNYTGLHYYGIARSGDELFLAGESGMLFRSEDWGQTWQALSSPYDGSFFGIMGSPRGDFIAVFGLRGTLYASRDSGQTWLPMESGGKGALSGGAFLCDGSFCVVSVDGLILHSRDDGQTLTAVPDTFPGSIALTETKGGVLAVVGLKGAVCIDLGKSDLSN